MAGNFTIKHGVLQQAGCVASSYAPSATIKVLTGLVEAGREGHQARKSSTKVSSWKTITGHREGQGCRRDVRVRRAAHALRQCTYYCPKKGWKKFTSVTSSTSEYCALKGVRIEAQLKGKWSLKLPGLSKGTIYVDTGPGTAPTRQQGSSDKAKLTK